MILLVAVIVLFALSSSTNIGQTIGATVVGIISVLVVRTLSAVRVFEQGLESNGTRMKWDKVVAYRLSWRLGAQRIMLVEQATKRELPMLLDVFESETFRSAVGDRANLDSLVRIGLP